jgi:hypothetical protein
MTIDDLTWFNISTWPSFRPRELRNCKPQCLCSTSPTRVAPHPWAFLLMPLDPAALSNVSEEPSSIMADALQSLVEKITHTLRVSRTSKEDPRRAIPLTTQDMRLKERPRLRSYQPADPVRSRPLPLVKPMPRRGSMATMDSLTLAMQALQCVDQGDYTVSAPAPPPPGRWEKRPEMHRIDSGVGSFSSLAESPLFSSLGPEPSQFHRARAGNPLAAACCDRQRHTSYHGRSESPRCSLPGSSQSSPGEIAFRHRLKLDASPGAHPSSPYDPLPTPSGYLPFSNSVHSALGAACMGPAEEAEGLRAHDSGHFSDPKGGHTRGSSTRTLPGANTYGQGALHAVSGWDQHLNPYVMEIFAHFRALEVRLLCLSCACISLWGGRHPPLWRSSMGPSLVHSCVFRIDTYRNGITCTQFKSRLPRTCGII